MKCPGCGYENLDLFETCKHCGPARVVGAATQSAPSSAQSDDLLSLRFEPDIPAPAVRPRHRATRGIRGDRTDDDFVEMLDDDGMEVREADLDKALPFGAGFVVDNGPPFRIDDELFVGYGPGVHEASGTSSGSVDRTRHRDGWPAVGADLSRAAFDLPDGEHTLPPAFEPVIDRDEEVPERYWAPEVAGLGRRALALLVDQLLLMAILGVFLLGALIALQGNNLTAGLLLSAEGLQASALPFVLLAALLSLSYSIFFHASTGRTPGKALVGVEVRTAAGGAITWGRALLRWLGAALGLACVGVGVIWAIFEPRRRGWADLISGTVVARLQRDPELEPSRR